MSSIIILGSIGIGAVVGWLFGILEPHRKLFSQILAIGMAGLAVLLDVALQASWQAALVALGSGFIFFLFNKLWRKELRSH